MATTETDTDRHNPDADHLTPAEIDWEYDPDETTGENVRRANDAIHAAGGTLADAKSFAFRYIPAAGPTLAERNWDYGHNAAEFM